MKKALFLGALLAAACGPKNVGSDAGVDAGATDSGFSACGVPGDQGNSLGVGQYCFYPGDCTHAGTVCSAIVNSTTNPENNTYVCVLPCDPCTDPAGFCGTGASCVCEQMLGGCGCFPDACSAFAMRVGTPPMCSDGGSDAGTPDSGNLDSGATDAGHPDGGDGG